MSKHPHFSSITVRPVALDAVLGRLDRLKQHSGQMKIDELWLDDAEPRSLTIKQVTSADGSTPVVVNITLASIQRMKRTLATLKRITSSLEDVISTVRANTRPALRHHGINSVPTEILSRIFTLACRPVTLDHLRISHVCRRFRGVAVKVPQLWTYNTPEQSLGWRNLQLLRSGNSFLIVDFSTHGRRVQTGKHFVYENPCTCLGYLAFIVKYAPRWSEFTFAVEHSSSTDEKVNTQIQALLAGLRLPRLEHLSIGENCNMSGDSEVFQSWKTPGLRILQCDNRVLRPLVLSVETFITSLKLTIESPSGRSLNSDALHILFHDKLAAVEDLYVKFDSPIGEDRDIAPANKNMSTCLHSLRSLTIEFNLFSPDDVINNVFKHIKMPKLESMIVRFELYFDDEDRGDYYRETDSDELMEHFDAFCQWLASPLPDFREQFTSLGTLRISISGNKEVDEESLEDGIRDRLCSGWKGDDLESDDEDEDEDFYDIIPEIMIVLHARPPPDDDSDY